MYPILVLGAGKIGASIVKLFYHSGQYQVTVADRDAQALQRLAQHVPVPTRLLDLTAPSDLAQALQGQRAVLSACSFDVNPLIAEAALAAGVSYFDLTEDVATTRVVRGLAANAAEGQVFMPQCGLAPGFIGILAHSLALQLERVDGIKMRVGALPQYPSNHLKYNLTWSTDGLINEYCNACDAIHQGERIEVLPLQGLERFALDGLEYEAFNTSGGLGTLCETWLGRIHELNYKTVRYPGHQYLMDFVINGLRLGSSRERRRQLKDILESSVPITRQDVVLIFASVSGWRDGQFCQLTDARKIYHQDVYGEHWSSIQLTTAASACAVVDLHRHGKLPPLGFVRQEDVVLADFLANPFGAHYAVARRAEELPQ